MDWTTFTQALLSTQTPLLPQPLVAQIHLHLSWALVLALAGAWLLRRGGVQPPLWRWGLPALLLLWTLWPGPLSPAWWLGLAFRAPSGLATLLCAFLLWREFRPASAARRPGEALRRWALAPVLLGWALLLDTFAVWPVSLYALGFAPLTLGVLALVCLLPWLLRGAKHGAPELALLLGAALVLHVALRLPSGNVWDALIDPWLWLALQVDWLLRALRRWRARQA